MEPSSSGILCIAGLGILLAAACWTDARSRRISNKLVLAGALAGFALNTLLPQGSGLFSAHPGGLGFLDSFSGFAVGLGALLPLYLLRAMGAGDVKLMAMIGAFLGPSSILGVVLMTFLAGGFLAIAVALWKGVLFSALLNVRSMLINTMMNSISGQGAQIEPLLATAAATLPYALAITAGTFLQILLAYGGHAIIS